MNRDRARVLLAEAGLDVLVAVRPENVRWIADLRLDLPLALELPVAVLLRREPLEIAAVVAPRVMAGVLGQALTGAEATTGLAWLPIDARAVWLYGRFHALAGERDGLSVTETAALALLEHAPGTGLSFERVLGDSIRALPTADRIAWDDAQVGAIAADAGRSAAADGASLVRAFRRVKAPSEVARLARAAEIAEDVELEIIRRSVAGADWAEVTADLPRLVGARDGVFGFFTGGAGRQGGFFYPPARHVLAPGEVIRLDIGLTFDGYWSDTGRTACVGGEAGAVATRLHEAMRRAVESTLDSVRPGVPLAALYAAAMSELRRAIPGYDRHHCGHTIGLRAYDGDLVALDDATPLEAGMTLSIEVPYYEVGWGGLQLEETVVVEARGYRPLTRLPQAILATGSASAAP